LPPSTARPERLPCARSCRIASRCWCPAISCACALAPPTSTTDAALGTDQGGRYLLVLDKNNTVEQRKAAIGPKVGSARDRERAQAGRSRRRRRHSAGHPGPAGRSAARDRGRDAYSWRRLNVFGRLSDPAEFAKVIVKTGRAGEITRLSDVGRVELGAQTYGQVWSKAPSTTSRRACRGARRRVPRCASCSARSSALRWC